MKSLILISLFIMCLSETKVVKPLKIADVFSGVKKTIYECVSTSTEASQTLKNFGKKNLESNENLPLNFNSIELTQEDREVIRKCKRDAFKAQTRRPNNSVIPISLQNAVHKRKYPLIKANTNKLRNLGMIDIIPNLGAFNIKGIFTCLEEAQPAIKVLRNTVTLWKSKDFTSAVINIYDNFKTITDGVTVCINSIFPA